MVAGPTGVRDQRAGDSGRRRAVRPMGGQFVECGPLCQMGGLDATEGGNARGSRMALVTSWWEKTPWLACRTRQRQRRRPRNGAYPKCPMPDSGVRGPPSRTPSRRVLCPKLRRASHVMNDRRGAKWAVVPLSLRGARAIVRGQHADEMTTCRQPLGPSTAVCSLPGAIVSERLSKKKRHVS
jgi:hypothetical protein